MSHMPSEDMIKGIIEELAKAVQPLLARDEYIDFKVLTTDETSKTLQESGIVIFKREV